MAVYRMSTGGTGSGVGLNDDGTYYELVTGSTKLLQVAKSGGNLEIAGDFLDQKTL